MRDQGLELPQTAQHVRRDVERGENRSVAGNYCGVGRGVFALGATMWEDPAGTGRNPVLWLFMAAAIFALLTGVPYVPKSWGWMPCARAIIREDHITIARPIMRFFR